MRAIALFSRMAIILAFSLVMPKSSRAAEAEYWVSAFNSGSYTSSTNKFGSGTLSDPYYGAFDKIMNDIPAYSRIHLLPGIFYTKGNRQFSGDWFMQAGQKVIGAGKYVTIIKKDNTVSDAGYDIEGIAFADTGVSGVEIADLTIDCSGTGSENRKRNGVTFKGSYSAVRRVSVINAVGILGQNKESFPIFLASGYATTGNIVDDCEVANVKGDYVSGIVVSGDAIVRNCHIYFPPITTYTSGQVATIHQGLTMADARNMLFDGNYVYGGREGVYTDTGVITNVTFVNNYLINVYQGLYLRPAGSISGVKILNNVIELNRDIAGTPTSDWFPRGVCIANFSGSVPMQHVQVNGNTIRLYQSDTMPANSQIAAFFYAGNVNDLSACDNIIDKRFTTAPNAATQVNFLNNRGLDGALREVRTYTDSDGASQTLSLYETTIFVNRSTSTTLTLPAAASYAGKQITIINQQSSSTVTITAASGESVLPGSASIVGVGTLRLTSNGGTAWYR